MGGGGVSNLGPGTIGTPGIPGGLGPFSAGENLLCLGFIPLAMISLILPTATVTAIKWQSTLDISSTDNS